jgi:hypothetical protein
VMPVIPLFCFLLAFVWQAAVSFRWNLEYSSKSIHDGLDQKRFSESIRSNKSDIKKFRFQKKMEILVYWITIVLNLDQPFNLFYLSS